MSAGNKESKIFYVFEPTYYVIILILYLIGAIGRSMISFSAVSLFFALLPLLIIPIYFLFQAEFIINLEGITIRAGRMRNVTTYYGNSFIPARNLLGVCLIDPHHNPIYALFYKGSSGKVEIMQLPFRHNICIHFKLAFNTTFPNLPVYHDCSSLTGSVLGRLINIIKPRFSAIKLVPWMVIFAVFNIAGILLVILGLGELVSLLTGKSLADRLTLFTGYFDQQRWIYFPLLLAILLTNLMIVHPRIGIGVYENGIGISKGGFPGFIRWDRIESIHQLKTMPRLIIKYKSQAELTRTIRIMGYFLEEEINELKEKVLANG